MEKLKKYFFFTFYEKNNIISISIKVKTFLVLIKPYIIYLFSRDLFTIHV